MKNLYLILVTVIFMGSLWLAMLPKDGVALPPSTQHLSKPSTQPGNVSKCDNPDCPCGGDCECDPCECPCDAKTAYVKQQGPAIYMLTSDDCIYCKSYQKPIINKLHREGYPCFVVDINAMPKVAEFVEYDPAKGLPQITISDGEIVVPFMDEGGVKSEAEIKQCFGMANPDYALPVKPNAPAAPLSTQSVVDEVHMGGSGYRYRPQRSGWFRGRSVRSCGPGGCR